MEENLENLLLRAGVVLIIAGIAFKVGSRSLSDLGTRRITDPPCPLPPFGRFLQGCRVLRLVELGKRPFLGMADFLLPLLGFVATFTIFFGNLAACSQRNLKRMLD